MAVTRDDVEHIARLARLALSDAELPQLTEQLNGILGHMDVLQRVDTRAVLPAAGVGDAGMRLRADDGPPTPLARGRASFAPETRDGFFIVPRLATHENASADDAGGADE
ncbi:MAG: Asp-tRNA(Asn)/Glu-tRNA(Gln) amidotransferase subunit GatC [Gemmatimonadaceae bacterium]